MSNINYEQIKNVSINNYQSSPFELFQDVETKSNFDGNIKHIQTESTVSEKMKENFIIPLLFSMFNSVSLFLPDLL